MDNRVNFKWTTESRKFWRTENSSHIRLSPRTLWLSKTKKTVCRWWFSKIGCKSCTTTWSRRALSPVWRPVTHTSRPKTTAKMTYGKVNSESLAALSEKHSTKMYLYGAKFTAVVNHHTLAALYNSHSQELPFTVAKHKSKLGWFDFNVVPKPGTTTPTDFGSQHSPPACFHCAREHPELGIEEKEEDAEIIVNRVDDVIDSVHILIFRWHTHKDKTLVLLEGIKGGQLREQLM